MVSPYPGAFVDNSLAVTEHSRNRVIFTPNLWRSY
jgi:hypothetical protein